MSKSKTRVHNTSIHFALTPKTAAHFAQLAGPRNSSKLVRALIYADLMDAAETTAGIHDIRLRIYREAVGKTQRKNDKWRVRIPVELRGMAEARARLLGFTMTEYVVALIARHAHREGLTRGGRYVRQ